MPETGALSILRTADGPQRGAARLQRRQLGVDLVDVFLRHGPRPHAGVAPGLLLGDLDGAGNFPTWASVVPRSKAGTDGDSRAITSPCDTCWPTCGSRPLATPTRPARLACTRPDADGSGITVPTISMVRAAFAVSVMDVRTPSSHCAGFGMKTGAIGQPARHVDANQRLAFRAVIVGSGQCSVEPAARDQRLRQRRPKGPMQPVIGERCLARPRRVRLKRQRGRAVQTPVRPRSPSPRPAKSRPKGGGYAQDPKRDVVSRRGRRLRNLEHTVKQVRHCRSHDGEHERLGAGHIEPVGRDLVDALSPPYGREALAIERNFDVRFGHGRIGLEVGQIDREFVAAGHRHEFEDIRPRLDTRQRLGYGRGGVAMVVALVRQRGPADQDGQERHEPSNERHVQSLRECRRPGTGRTSLVYGWDGMNGPCEATRFACRFDPVAHAGAVLGADAQRARGRTLRLSEGGGTGGQPRSWRLRRGRPQKKPARGGDRGKTAESCRRIWGAVAQQQSMHSQSPRYDHAGAGRHADSRPLPPADTRQRRSVKPRHYSRRGSGPAWTWVWVGISAGAAGALTATVLVPVHADAVPVRLASANIIMATNKPNGRTHCSHGCLCMMVWQRDKIKAG